MIKITASIDVPDLAKAEEFYINALGCQKLRNQGDDMVVLSTGNCDIYLQAKAAESKPTPLDGIVREYGRHWTPVHLDFLTDNVVGGAEKVVQMGGQHEGGDSGEWGQIAYCVDPFGNGFCLINE